MIVSDGGLSIDVFFDAAVDQSHYFWIGNGGILPILHDVEVLTQGHGWTKLTLCRLDQPASGDTGGLFFPLAIQHTLIGLYLQQVVLAALFFLGKGFGEGVVTVVLI